MTIASWHIGSFDGTTWTESEKTLTLGVELVDGEDDGENLHIGLAVSKGTLVLGSDDNADGGGGVPDGLLVAVPGTDLTGTYTELDSGATVAVRENGGMTAA